MLKHQRETEDGRNGNCNINEKHDRSDLLIPVVAVDTFFHLFLLGMFIHKLMFLVKSFRVEGLFWNGTKWCPGVPNRTVFRACFVDFVHVRHRHEQRPRAPTSSQFGVTDSNALATRLSQCTALV